MSWGEDRVMCLMCLVLTRLCALPLEHVVETMRPLPTELLAGGPKFIRGVSIIRGEPVPVVDAASLMGGKESCPTRLVALNTDGRRVAVAVDAVLGVQAIPVESLHDLPPLLADVDAEVISGLGTLDAELLVVLHSARLVPESVWGLLEQETPAT